MKHGTDSAVELKNTDCQKSISVVLRKRRRRKVNKRFYERKKSEILLLPYCLENVLSINSYDCSFLKVMYVS